MADGAEVWCRPLIDSTIPISQWIEQESNLHLTEPFNRLSVRFTNQPSIQEKSLAGFEWRAGWAPLPRGKRTLIRPLVPPAFSERDLLASLSLATLLLRVWRRGERTSTLRGSVGRDLTQTRFYKDTTRHLPPVKEAVLCTWVWEWPVAAFTASPCQALAHVSYTCTIPSLFQKSNGLLFISHFFVVLNYLFQHFS